MNPITTTDLAQALRAHETALRQYGMIDPADRLGMTSGSKLYGNSFRLYLIKPGSSAHHQAPIVDWLGMTKREAYNALTTATACLYRTVDMLDRFPRQAVA